MQYAIIYLVIYMVGVGMTFLILEIAHRRRECHLVNLRREISRQLDLLDDIMKD